MIVVAYSLCMKREWGLIQSAHSSVAIWPIKCLAVIFFAWKAVPFKVLHYHAALESALLYTRPQNVDSYTLYNSVITSCISGRGNRIGPVCLCVCLCVRLSALSRLNRLTYGRPHVTSFGQKDFKNVQCGRCVNAQAFSLILHVTPWVMWRQWKVGWSGVIEPFSNEVFFILNSSCQLHGLATAVQKAAWRSIPKEMEHSFYILLIILIFLDYSKRELW